MEARKGFYKWIGEDLEKNGFETQVIIDDFWVKLLAKHQSTDKIVNVFYDIINGKYIIAFGVEYHADIQEQFTDPDEAIQFYQSQIQNIKQDWGTDLSDLV